VLQNLFSNLSHNFQRASLSRPRRLPARRPRRRLRRRRRGRNLQQAAAAASAASATTALPPKRGAKARSGTRWRRRGRCMMFRMRRFRRTRSCRGPTERLRSRRRRASRRRRSCPSAPAAPIKGAQPGFLLPHMFMKAQMQHAMPPACYLDPKLCLNACTPDCVCNI